jgi:nucleoside-diphosphate-sugar epimerase
LSFCKRKRGGHIVYISSLSIYERDENEYFDIYGRTKKQAEEIAQAYCDKYQIKLTILRLSQVYDDARKAASTQSMLYYFIDKIAKEGEITIFGKTNPLRNYVHIDYVTSVIEEVVAHEKDGLYNVVELRNHTVAEIAYMIFSIVGKNPNIRYLEEKPDIGNVYIPHDNRYQSDSIKPIHLDEGIKRILGYA